MRNPEDSPGTIHARQMKKWAEGPTRALDPPHDAVLVEDEWRCGVSTENPPCELCGKF